MLSLLSIIIRSIYTDYYHYYTCTDQHIHNVIIHIYSYIVRIIANIILLGNLIL